MRKCSSCEQPVPPDSSFCHYCGKSIPVVEETMDFQEEVAELLAQGRKIEAIKVYRKHTGCDLKDAKDAMEAIEQGDDSPDPSLSEQDLEQELVALLEQNELIKAVKLHRKRTGADLKTSRNAVHSVASRHGITIKAVGCSRFAAILVLVVLLIGIAQTYRWIQRPRRMTQEFAGHLFHQRYDEAERMLKPPSALKLTTEGDLVLVDHTGTSTTVPAKRLPFVIGGGKPDDSSDFSMTALQGSTNGMVDSMYHVYLTLEGSTIRIEHVDF